jgi:hypothetical protein
MIAQTPCNHGMNQPVFGRIGKIILQKYDVQARIPVFDARSLR